jgi:predicted lipid-binding transport protein (Tim44 family)
MKRRTALFLSTGMLALTASAAPAADDGMYGDVPRDGLLDGSLIGSLVSGTEYTGIGMVDLIFFALLAFAFLSVMRMLRTSRAARPGDSGPRPQPRHTLPRSPGPQGHDPWARLRSVDSSSAPRPAPGQDRPAAQQSAPAPRSAARPGLFAGDRVPAQ